MLRQTREADLGLFARLANTGPLQGPGSCADAHFAPGLRDQRVENRISDRLHDFHPFFDYRPGDCQRVDGIGDDDGSPATIALPFKLMLFVLVDGWQLLVGSLAQSFYS